MGLNRALAIAGALLALLAVAGCGLGPGEGLDPVRLTVTHDYGRELVLAEEVEDATEADTVMRVLEGAAEIGTKEGGRFVKAIDGVESASRGGRYFDWLFYVNGVESTVGAADYPLRGGEAIWWDYRDWTSALHVPAVVGSPAGAIRLLVGPWAQLRGDPAARQIENGVEEGGVFATFRGGGQPRLEGLGESGEVARRFGPDAGLVAATRRFEAPPTWLVTGVTAAGVRAAASLLNEEKLRDHYAVAVESGEETPLPLPGR